LLAEIEAKAFLFRFCELNDKIDSEILNSKVAEARNEHLPPYIRHLKEKKNVQLDQTVEESPRTTLVPVLKLLSEFYI